MKMWIVVLVCGAGVVQAEEVTFAKDIAPIVYGNCTQCHRPGEAGGLSFRSYDEVKSSAKLIAKVTASGYMPPWKVTPGHGDFLNARGLSAAQVGLIQSWVAQGMPEGDPALAPPLPVFTEGWQLGEPDLVVTMPDQFTVPASGPDVYVNFVVPLPAIPAGKYLRAIEYRPTAKTTAHHTLFALDTKGLGRELDADEPGPGFSGMAAGLRKSRIGGWALGGVPAPYPKGAAVPIPAGADLILEAHFHPSGKEEVEQAKLGIFLTDEVPTHQLVNVPVPFQFGVGLNLRIPAGEKHYEVSDTFTLPVDSEIHNIFPHAHYICKEMQATATLPDGTEKELIWITDWDFAWQEQYTFREPVKVPAGTVVKARFVYDNSAENPRNPTSPPKEVTWGPESTDEMASLAVNVIPVNNTDTAKLKAAIEDYRMAALENVDIALIRKAAEPLMKARLDTNKDGSVSFTERMAGIQKARKRMGEDAGFSPALFLKFSKGILGL
jgi:hypothetical protein